MSHIISVPQRAARVAGCVGEAHGIPGLQLVRSYEGRHGTVPLDGLAAAQRVFEQIPWKGMPPSHVAALIGQPTMREAAENKWSYDLVQGNAFPLAVRDQLHPEVR